MPQPIVTVIHHRALGSLVRLHISDAIPLDLTCQEASILTRALTAVRDGKSIEREIFMSPVASDDSFCGTVIEEGLLLTCGTQTQMLDWTEVSLLAENLATAALKASANPPPE